VEGGARAAARPDLWLRVLIKCACDRANNACAHEVLQADSPTVNKGSMSWYGKVIGAVLGAIVGRGLLGAIVGLLIGHQFDRRSDEERRRPRAVPSGGAGDPRLAFFEATFRVMGHVAKADGRVSEQEIDAAREAMRRFSLSDADRRRAIDLYTQGKQPDFPLEPALQRFRAAAAGGAGDLRLAFFEATFRVMGHVAKADGRVSEQEIDAARQAMRRFSLNDADRRRAIDLFTQGKQPDFPLEATLQRFRALAAGQPDLCRLFVQIQLQAALQGNGINAPTRSVFARMCGALGVSALEFASLEAMLRMHAAGGAQPGGAGGGQSRGPSARLADAYEVLGVPASARDAEVTKAYRRLMSQNHPDKLVAQGLPESMVAAAHERTQRILEAYVTGKNHRGIR
jgi:DnaJ like chaperone protein